MPPVPLEQVLQNVNGTVAAVQAFLEEIEKSGLLSGQQVQSQLFNEKITVWPIIFGQPPQPMTKGPVDVKEWKSKTLFVYPIGQPLTIDVLYSVDGGLTLAPLQGATGQSAPAGSIFRWTTEDVVTHIGVKLIPGASIPSSVRVLVRGG